MQKRKMEQNKRNNDVPKIDEMDAIQFHKQLISCFEDDNLLYKKIELFSLS